MLVQDPQVLLSHEKDSGTTFAVRMYGVAGYSPEKWIELTVRGFAELSRFRGLEAARQWLEADAALTEETTAFAPLHAASRSNSGAAYILLEQRVAAERAFDEAECAWKNVIARVATLDVPMTGVSSSFHFRLAAATPDALIDARRDRYRHLVQAALAITRFNRRLLDVIFIESDAMSRSAHELRSTISDSLGYASAEAHLLAAMEEGRNGESLREIYAGKLSDITRRPTTLASSLSEDCKKIEHAVMLTALLTPPICPALRPDRRVSFFSENLPTCD